MIHLCRWANSPESANRYRQALAVAVRPGQKHHPLVHRPSCLLPVSGPTATLLSDSFAFSPYSSLIKTVCAYVQYRTLHQVLTNTLLVSFSTWIECCIEIIEAG